MLLQIYLDPEDEGSTFVRNIGFQPNNNTCCCNPVDLKGRPPYIGGSVILEDNRKYFTEF
jgi:hypothetical protein